VEAVSRHKDIKVDKVRLPTEQVVVELESQV
jgi:hypothetical protein